MIKKNQKLHGRILEKVKKRINFLRLTKLVINPLRYDLRLVLKGSRNSEEESYIVLS